MIIHNSHLYHYYFNNRKKESAKLDNKFMSFLCFLNISLFYNELFNNAIKF
jgi:hypothetical protein